MMMNVCRMMCMRQMLLFFEKEFRHRRCQKLPQNYAYAYSICACVRVRVRVCLFFELQLLLYYDVDSDAINLVVTLYEFK